MALQTHIDFVAQVLVANQTLNTVVKRLNAINTGFLDTDSDESAIQFIISTAAQIASDDTSSIVNNNNTTNIGKWVNKTVSIDFKNKISPTVTDLDVIGERIRVLYQNWFNQFSAEITDETIDTTGKTKADVDGIMPVFNEMAELLGQSSAAITPNANQDVIDKWLT